ncbi:MAG: CDP-alcohol phosphatidyltransferase family protein [Deltaproteobacteria bacterium]|nr:CDP-alcohol phosphatidyltransferase family protein [Deltaproteobacteria bacterium]
MESMRDEPPLSIKPEPEKEFFHYFGKDRFIHVWFANKRTRMAAALVPLFKRLGLVPDTISYIGIALLAGVVLYFVRSPRIAVMFLAAHILCDGLDGAYARYAGKASQSGAFTDLVCDQLGMVVVATLAVFHHFVEPLLGCIYITLYLIVVVFGVIINFMGLGTRITLTNKYFLYAMYGVWAGWGQNYFPLFMSVCSVLMTGEVLVGYFRLKRGIRRKFDAEVRFTQGDAYSSKLNYALNAAVPLTVLLAILVWANQVPIRAVLDNPKMRVEWRPGPVLVEENEFAQVIGFGVQENKFLLMLENGDGAKVVRRTDPSGKTPVEEFVLPNYMNPAFTAFPVTDGVLYVVDRTTHLLMGINLESSFRNGRAVILLTLPMSHLRITAMGATQHKGKDVWLVANYLYTRKTYLIDPGKAIAAGSILNGREAAYINGGFPSGLAIWEDTVLELNRSPRRSLVYVAPLKSLLGGKGLLDARTTSFAPPDDNAVGPAIQGSDLVMLSGTGRIFRAPLRSVLK